MHIDYDTHDTLHIDLESHNHDINKKTMARKPCVYDSSVRATAVGRARSGMRY